MRMRTNSFGFRIMALVLLTTTIALVSFAAILLIVDRHSSVAMLDDRLAILADITGQNSTGALVFRDQRAASETLQALGHDRAIVAGCLYDPSGFLFAEYYRDKGLEACPRKSDKMPFSSRSLRRVNHPIFRRQEQVGRILITSDLGLVKDRQRRMGSLAGVLALFSLGVGALSGLLLERRLAKPIFDLSRAMGGIASSGNYGIRVDAAGSEEIRQLAHGFNHMASELELRDQRTKRAEVSLYEQARRDSLTGLPNRRAFLERMNEALDRARQDRQGLALLYIDLDGFKLVNDSLGHSAGDTLLGLVASRLSSGIRISDTLARVGGDEFTVILPGLKAPEDAGRIADSLLYCLADPFTVEDQQITVGCSIGISLWAGETVGSDDLLKQADSAMYAAKRAGRNRAVYFSPDLGLMARERLALENELRSAIARKEIYVDYQPIFETASGDLIRFEALARWKHPLLGQVSPDKFIPVAEECGLIHELGAYILDLACREAALWEKAGSGTIRIAVNFSAVQFNSDRVVPQIEEALARAGLRPDRLQLELTESVMLGSLPQCAAKIKQLRELGISVSIDDFGTGYSSLAYLPDLPVESIKIDRAFLREIQTSTGAAGILEPIIAMAHKMGIRVVVEGIENPAQLELLRGLGADEVQGFLLGRPGPEPLAQISRHSTGHEEAPAVQGLRKWEA